MCVLQNSFTVFIPLSVVFIKRFSNGLEITIRLFHISYENHFGIVKFYLQKNLLIN